MSGSSAPIHHRVAFVGQHDSADLARRCDDAGKLVGGQHRPGRIGRGVDPDSFNSGDGPPGIRVGDIVDLVY